MTTDDVHVWAVLIHPQHIAACIPNDGASPSSFFSLPLSLPHLMCNELIGFTGILVMSESVCYGESSEEEEDAALHPLTAPSLNV